MSIEFPHLNDTQFPGVNDSDNLSGVDVYKYENDFDYYRWVNKVSIKLLNVLWNSNYADVPYFDTDAARDTWFDNQEGIIRPLETPFNVTPETSVQLAVPYNDAYKYNYLVVDIPMQTSVNQPIDYESENTRVKRWYYFIEDIEQLSPNTTRFILTVDYWTTFIHSVSINYLMLERGHAPMTKVTVEQYLANPIANSEYLLADDFNYQRGDSIIKASNFTPIGNGKKYVVFAAPYDTEDFATFGGVDYEGQSTLPTFEDTQARWGYQYQVNDYDWKYGGVDYSEARLPIKGYETQDNLVFNGCNCFAIEASRARYFFNQMAHRRVQFIHGIKATFILDESMFSRDEGFTFEGETLYKCHRQISELAYTFQKSAFGFDAKYANLAKLYTSPYSFVEITDDNGKSFTFNIENTGHIKMHSEVSLAFPFLRYNIFFTGINGDGQFNYTWVNLNDANVTKPMFESDFSKFMMNWDIPTYGISISSSSEYAVNNGYTIPAQRQAAIYAYRAALRPNNTLRENVADTMQTNTTNVAASGAANVSNVRDSGNANSSNVSASGATNVDNVAANGATANTNQAVQNAANADITGYTANDTQGTIGNVRADGINERINTKNRLTNTEVVDKNVTKLDTDYIQDNRMLIYTTQIDNYYASITGAINSGAGLVTGVTSTVQAFSRGAAKGVEGGMQGMAVAGGIDAAASIINTGVNVASTVANTYVGISNASDITNLASDVNEKKYKAARDNMKDVNEKQRDNSKAVMELTNEGMRYATNTGNTANATITDNVVTTNNANADRTRLTNNGNADRTRLTNNGNADRTRNTNNANATRTQNTETNNATYNRNATVANAQDTLRQTQANVRAAYESARLTRPVLQGNYDGDAYPDIWQRRGYRFNIRTQTESAIKQAGDGFLRFGYALNRVWDMSHGFNYMRHFTFWKASDIWVNDGTGVANIATKIIGDILLKGVTVWSNPAEIGMVSIYDN